MTTDRQSRKFSIKHGLWIGTVSAVFFLQFRLLTFCILALLMVMFFLVPRLRQTRCFMAAGILVVVSMVLPFDVAIGSFHYGQRRGTSSGGPHLVEFVVGMPMHTRLIERYGEYISSGCAWPVAYPPRWILVWN